jgi:demethylmenaquinone methyltransferase/2-methoxy-6-polyprenyl-1,4-benzoquinol methylase
MFGAIAHRYDLLNHLLSLNIDRSWRRTVARRLQPRPGGWVLDCCTGTGDLAIAFDRRLRGSSPIVGTDFCRPMLEKAREKISREKGRQAIALFEADTQSLPFADATFDVVVVAFGLRNVADTVRGLDEMIRVLQPGGRLGVLEFSRPTQPVLARIYGSFFRHVLPRVGQALAPNGYDAYDYLPSSVAAFPEGEAMLALMASRGLETLERFPFTFGIATFYVGQKPTP